MTTKPKLSPEEAARRAAHDEAIAAYNRVNTALGHARSTVDMLEIEVERLAAVCQSFMPQPEPNPAEWVLSEEDDPASGWHLDLPGHRSAFVLQIGENGLSLLAANVPPGFWEWSVGGNTKSYVDFQGVEENLEDAQRAAELAALKAVPVRS